MFDADSGAGSHPAQWADLGPGTLAIEDIISGRRSFLHWVDHRLTETKLQEASAARSNVSGRGRERGVYAASCHERQVARDIFYLAMVNCACEAAERRTPPP